MIRKLLNGDIDRVADIWLKTNLKTHYFISNQYWKSNYELVKEMMLQSEVYVYEDDKMIQGFVGLNDEYIEGIFVSDEMQSCGIGRVITSQQFFLYNSITFMSISIASIPVPAIHIPTINISNNQYTIPLPIHSATVHNFLDCSIQ